MPRPTGPQQAGSREGCSDHCNADPGAGRETESLHTQMDQPHAPSSKDATRGSWPYYILGARTPVSVSLTRS